jgi:hypothetical protein
MSQGTIPAIARQWTGQTATQSPQPVQWVSSRTGISRIVVRRWADRSPDRRCHQAEDQILDYRLLQRRE